MKFIIENTVCLNTGDAAILLAIRHILKHVFDEPLEIHVFDSQPDVAQRLYDGYKDLTFHRLLADEIYKVPYHREDRLKNKLKLVYNRLLGRILKFAIPENGVFRNVLTARQKAALDLYRKANMVITTGGTYLVETYNLDKRLKQFELDLLLGKAPVFFTQSLGPFRKPDNIRRLRPVVERSPLVLLRDQYSHDNIAGMTTTPQKCHVVADSVFALADIARIEEQLANPANPPTNRVAISVRRWNYVEGGDSGMSRYIEAVRSMTETLVRQHGKDVVFLSTCQGVPEYHHDDSKTARLIVEGLAADIREKVSVDGGFHTPHQLMEKLKGFDFVISTRMHMMIMALCVGTPVLPIAYEFKTKELSKRLGIEDILLDIDTVTSSEALSHLAAFLRDFAHYRRVSLQAAIKEAASALSVASLLRAIAPRGRFDQHVAKGRKPEEQDPAAGGKSDYQNRSNSII